MTANMAAARRSSASMLAHYSTHITTCDCFASSLSLLLHFRTCESWRYTYYFRFYASNTRPWSSGIPVSRRRISMLDTQRVLSRLEAFRLRSVVPLNPMPLISRRLFCHSFRLGVHKVSTLAWPWLLFTVVIIIQRVSYASIMPFFHLAQFCMLQPFSRNISCSHSFSHLSDLFTSLSQQHPSPYPSPSKTGHQHSPPPSPSISPNRHSALA